MNCVLDCVNLGYIVVSLGLSWGILKGCSLLDDELKSSNQNRWCFFWMMYGTAAGIGQLYCLQKAGQVEKLSLLLLAVYFVTASVMDSMCFGVNDFIQYVGVMGSVIRVSIHLSELECGWSLLGFAMVQQVLFRKMYGEADVMAFLVSALYLAGCGKGIEYYLLHMAICYILLAIVQIGKRNVAKNGNLKNEVALYPYISMAFLLIICQ